MSGRCRSCNKVLSEYEMTRKITGIYSGKTEYADMCSHCLNESNTSNLYLYENREDLKEYEDWEEDEA